MRMIVMQSVLCNWVQGTIYSEAWQAVAGHYTLHSYAIHYIQSC